jgi:outer membrane lipoprotein-sorting protein
MTGRSSPRPAQRREGNGAAKDLRLAPRSGERPPAGGRRERGPAPQPSAGPSPLPSARCGGRGQTVATIRAPQIIRAGAILLAGALVALSPVAAAKPAAGSKPAAAAAKAPADIDALLAGLSKAPGLYAHFREEKHITVLQQPLVSEGNIYFTQPSRFARHTEKPTKAVMIIDGNQLQFGNADGQESMNLAANPVARLFADAFVMLLSGNRAGLEKIFTMQLTPRPGAAGEWKLMLTPRVAPMDKMIKEMELRGRGLSLDELDVREASGDWTRTSFTNVDLNRRYTAAEQAKLFKLPVRP